MKNLNKIVPRRTFMKNGAIFLSTPLLTACSMRGALWKRHATYAKINSKAHWARRNEWNGQEAVVGIVQIGDRYLMVRRTDGMGWSFPGGFVIPERHGEKDEEAQDLINAVTSYAHDQALVPVMGDEGVIHAYGYVIDSHNNRMLMTHWLKLAIPNDFPPTPNPNLKETLEAKWIAPDDPVIGSCLKQRIAEIARIKEGGTIGLDSCRTD